jgi:hypothetical protein
MFHKGLELQMTLRWFNVFWSAGSLNYLTGPGQVSNISNHVKSMTQHQDSSFFQRQPL